MNDTVNKEKYESALVIISKIISDASKLNFEIDI